MQDHPRPRSLFAILFALPALLALGCSEPDAPRPKAAAAPLGLPDLPDGDLRTGRRLVYQVAVRSFQDSDDDGTGDLEGLRRRLGYLRELGVGLLILEDVVEAGTADGGRAARDWGAIDALVGDEESFAALAVSAAAEGIALGLTLPLNHVDEGHAWWQAARASTAAAERGFFRTATAPILCEDVPNIPLDPYRADALDGSDRWTGLDDDTFAYHRFAATSPDVRLDVAAVADAAAAAVARWRERGITALMLPDAYAWQEDGDGCDQQPASHDLLAAWRAAGVFDDMALLGFPRPPIQAPQSDHDLTVGWLGSPGAPELDGVTSGDLTEWLRQAFVDPAARVALRDAIRRHAELRSVADGEAGQVIWTSGHAETTRLAATAGDDRGRRLALSLILGAPFTPWLFYGDELGLGPSAGDSSGDWRNLGRAAMPWAADEPNLGFGKQPPPMPGPIGAADRTVDRQVADEGSVLAWARRLMRLRYHVAALREGGWADLDVRDPQGRVPGDVIGFLRSHANGGLVVLVNFSDAEVRVDVRLPESGWAAGTPLHDLLGDRELVAAHPGDPSTLSLTVPRRGALWVGPQP
jgi:glycosidase